MSGFLDSMAVSSARRAAVARRREPLSVLEARARATPPAPPLRLSSGFDVIAELKLRSPAGGELGTAADDWAGRVAAYARGGAAAVSVLTEPSRFDGALEHLAHAARVLNPLGVPAMRKDFLVDPYQLAEARAAGAGGALLIVRMLPAAQTAELLAAAADYGLFVLLEAFDAGDLAVAAQLLGARRADAPPVLIGINCRDLQTLKVVPARFEELAPHLPAGYAAVAESGVTSAAEARHVRGLGYGVALIGTALMQHGVPERLLDEIIRAART